MDKAKKSTGPVFVRAREAAFYASSRVRPGQVVQVLDGEPVPAWGDVVPAPPAAPAVPPPPLATMSSMTHGRATSARAPGELPPTTREAAEIAAAQALNPPAEGLLS